MVISIVRSLPLAGCWMLTQARRLSRRIEVEAGELRARACRWTPSAPRPSPASVRSPSWFRSLREPDVVVDAAVAVLDDVDVAVVVDREVVRAGQRGADRQPRSRGRCVLRFGEDGDRLRAAGRARRPRSVVVVATYRYSRPLHRLDLQVLGALVVGALERRRGSVVLRASTEVTPLRVGDGQRAGQRGAARVGERHPGVGAGGVRRVAVADAQHEGLAGGEVVGLAGHDVSPSLAAGVYL